MKYRVSTEVTLTVVCEVNARSKAEAVMKANADCGEITPLFICGNPEIDRPSMVEVENAWFEGLDQCEIFSKGKVQRA